MATPRGAVLDDAVLRELLGGCTWVEAAEHIGCSRSAIARRARDPAFRQRLADARSTRIERISDQLTAASTAAVAYLEAVIADADAPVSQRVRSAVWVVRLAAAVRDEVDYEKRLGEIESQLAAYTGLRAVH